MIKVILTATAFTARGFRPDGTREVFSGQRSVDGGVSWSSMRRDLEGGVKTMRRNAFGWPIRPILSLRLRRRFNWLDHVIVLEEVCSRT